MLIVWLDGEPVSAPGLTLPTVRPELAAEGLHTIRGFCLRYGGTSVTGDLPERGRYAETPEVWVFDLLLLHLGTYRFRSADTSDLDEAARAMFAQLEAGEREHPEAKAVYAAATLGTLPPAIRGPESIPEGERRPITMTIYAARIPRT